MKQFFFVFACLFCLAACLDNVAFFPGRSAQVIISPSNIQDESFLLLLNNQRVLKQSNEKQIDEDSVADLIGHILGTPILNDEASRVAFPTSSIFNKPTGNLLIVIDGVDSAFGQLLQVDAQKLKLNRISFPEDSIATMATLSSGQTPSVHGIVGSSWRNSDDIIEAYSAAQSKSANFADMLLQSFEGKSLTLSVSGNFQSAAAFSVHQDLQALLENSNDQAFYWNFDSNRFDSVFGSSIGSALQLSRADILSKVASRSNVELFDLKSQTDFLFFAELEMIQSTVASLGSDADLSVLVGDSTPDALTFVFSSMKGIVAKYGASSSQATAAASLVSELISQIVDSLNTLYNNKLATEIIVLAPSAFDAMKVDSVSQIVYQAVEQDVESKEVFDAFFPAVYLNDETDVESVCDAVTEKLPAGYTATCNAEFYEYTFVYKASDNSTSDDDDSTAEFQIVLWMSILLALVLAGIMYIMCGLSEGDDTLLYRSTKKAA